MTRAEIAIVQPAIDLVAIWRSVQAAHVAYQDASRQRENSERNFESWKSEESRRRFALGRELAVARKAYPLCGPNAKRWGEDLAAQGMTTDQALDWMKYAGYVDGKFSGIGGGLIPENSQMPTYAEAGIANQPRKTDQEQPDLPHCEPPTPEPFHILIAAGDFKSKIHKQIDKWPEESKRSIPGLLRDLADDLERGFSC